MEGVRYDEKLSRSLAKILRHRAHEYGLNIKPDGYIPIKLLFKHFLHNYNLDDVITLIELDPVKRYQLRYEGGEIEIKANHGHSIPEINNLKLSLIKNPTYEIVHGSCIYNLESFRVDGIRLKRNYILFCKGVEHYHLFSFYEKKIVPTRIYVHINYHEASKDGIQFFESENGTILSKGNEHGIIEPKYFIKIVDIFNQEIPM